MKAFFKSFLYALRGIFPAIRGHRNIKVMLLAAVLSLSLAILLRLDRPSVAIILLTCGGVLSLEMVNTALETLLDKIHPEADPVIGRVKDILAGAVLVLSLFAGLIGLILLGPALWDLMSKWSIK